MERLIDKEEYRIGTQKLLASETMMKNKRLKVLVVDDNYLNCKVARYMLTSLGYDVEEANSGQKAIQMFDSSYAFILMDISMPEMDGMETTRLIREKELTMDSHVIIIASTCNGEDFKQPCLDAGMDDFMPKPLEAEQLESILKKYQ